MKSNEQLQKDVQAELRWEPSLDEAGIGVSTHDGVVTLSGHVTTYTEKLAAERAAKRVAGVHAVADELVIELPARLERDDTDIAEAALNALRWHTSIPSDSVRLVVSKGWVTMDGEVEWQYQKSAAAAAVRPLMGVKGVINKIEIKPRIGPVQIQEKIEDALKRSAEVDAKQIRVEVDGTKVVLRGTVRSWAELDDAERAAWSAPGIGTVESHLRVEAAALVY